MVRRSLQKRNPLEACCKKTPYRTNFRYVGLRVSMQFRDTICWKQPLTMHITMQNILILVIE